MCKIFTFKLKRISHHRHLHTISCFPGTGTLVYGKKNAKEQLDKYEERAERYKKIQKILDDDDATLDVPNKEDLSTQIANTVERLETQNCERISEKITSELRIEIQHGNENMISKRLGEVKVEIEQEIRDIKNSVTENIVETKVQHELVKEKVGHLEKRMDDLNGISTTAQNDCKNVQSKVSDLQEELRVKQLAMKHEIEKLKLKDIKEVDNKLSNHIQTCEIRQKVCDDNENRHQQHHNLLKKEIESMTKPKRPVEPSDKDTQELRKKLLECSQSIKMCEMKNTQQDNTILQLDKSCNELKLQLISVNDNVKLTIGGIENSHRATTRQLDDLKTEIANVNKLSGEHEQRILVSFGCSSRNIHKQL
jgi:chromosome segregation ATPase